MTSDFVIDIERGRLDATSATTFERCVERAITQGAGQIDILCGAVSMVDSTGLGALVRSLKRCRAAKAHLRLIDATPPLVRLLQMTRLLGAFDLQKSTASDNGEC